MLVFDQATPGEWAAALDLAYRHLLPKARQRLVRDGLVLLRTGAMDSRGLRVARQGGAVGGVQVCEPLGGACCLFWQPAVREELRETDLHEQLVRAGLAWCRSQGHKIGQFLLSPEAETSAGPFLRAGFRQVTTLEAMSHPLAERPAVTVPPLQYEMYADERREAFEAALLRSYEGTCDCPELNGVRTIGEILAGHRAAGRFRPELWWLAHLDREPAGVALLTELPDAVTWELSYLGVVPEHRRRGVGRALTVRALDTARRGGAAQLTVAVDRRNAPARVLYRSLGFTTGEAHLVYLYLFPQSAAGDGSAAGARRAAAD